MTRVYEASRRATASATSERRTSAPTSVPDDVVISTQSMFDRYSREARVSAEELPLPAPAVDSTGTSTGSFEKLFSSAAIPRAIADDRLIASGNMLPVYVEQYRALAAALQNVQDRSRWSGNSAVERGLKTLMVTSAVPQEGKTLTVVNVAFALSDLLERRVLVIDANLRNPSIHDLFGVPNTRGLGDLLSPRVRDASPLQISARMSVLPAGRSVAGETMDLASNQMRGLLDECSTQFDWVLIDAPAVSAFPDPQQLIRVVRAVLFVIRSGSTPMTRINNAMSGLGRGSIIGTVLNRAGRS